MATKKFIEPIPDRRRTRFAPNGGPRPTPAQRRAAQRGITAAREVLASTQPENPRHSVTKPMTSTQRSTARSGIDAARDALSA